jgi:hypothetical protein
VRLEDDVREVAVRICDQVAGAIEKYAHISGEGPYDTPEHFLAAQTLSDLGDVLAMTMETNSNYLWEVHHDVLHLRSGTESGLSGNKRPPRTEIFRGDTGSQRVDLVVYHGDHAKKDHMEIFCIVEFKKSKFSPEDCQKIPIYFRHFPTIPFGIVVFYCDARKEREIANSKHLAVEVNGDLTLGRVAHPQGDANGYQTFACILRNPDYINPPQEKKGIEFMSRATLMLEVSAGRTGKTI